MDDTSGIVVVLAGVRALHTAATLVLFGTLVFVAFVDERAGTSRRGLLLAWLAVAASGIAWLAVEGVEMSGGSWAEASNASTLGAVLGSTVFGRTWLVRGVLLVVLGVLAVRHRPQDRRGLPALVACSGALLPSLAWAGHANAQPGLDGAVHHFADAAHLLAAGAWVGGLPLFVARLRPSTASADMAHTAGCVRRYGDLAAICVGVLVASGAVNAAYALRVPALLLESAYGRLLLVKLELFGVMLAIAALNRWWLTPRLRVADAAGAMAAGRLRRLAWIEALLGAAVLVLASVLATSAPPMRM